MLDINVINQKYKKQHTVDVRSGDTVRVHQKIREAGKERIQVFEGLVIRTKRKNSHTASITVRRIASGVGVEKTYLIHSPLITKIEVIKRSRVRRNYLSYMRQRTGKSARLAGVDFDKEKVNYVPDVEAKPEQTKPEEPAEDEKPKEAKTEEKPKAEEEPKSEKKTEEEQKPKKQPK